MGDPMKEQILILSARTLGEGFAGWVNDAMENDRAAVSFKSVGAVLDFSEKSLGLSEAAVAILASQPSSGEAKAIVRAYVERGPGHSDASPVGRLLEFSAYYAFEVASRNLGMEWAFKSRFFRGDLLGIRKKGSDTIVTAEEFLKALPITSYVKLKAAVTGQSEANVTLSTQPKPERV